MRFSNTKELKEYSLNLRCFISSFLALKTIKELATLEQENHPLAAKVLQESVYVDDCVSRADSVESALQLQSELVALLKKGCFELRKWASNHPALLSAVPSSHTQISFDTEGPSFIKVLGIQCNPSLDFFTYSCTPLEGACTKRNVLIQIARIFDVQAILQPPSYLQNISCNKFVFEKESGMK